MFNPSPHTFGRQEWLECMEKVKSRDTQAFALVFSYYSPKLKQFVMKHVGSEQVALELVQETMSTVWQKASLFDGQKSSLATWIYTIARNLSYDLLRRQKGRDAYVLADDIWPEDYCPPDLVDHYAPEQDLLKEQVMKFLDRLPEAQQQVIKAVYLEEIPQQDVADMLDIPLGTVKSRLRLAVEKLRLSMDAESLCYHPNYALLAAYAEGGLDSAHGLAISAHLEICPHCRDLVHEIEAELGELLNQQAASSVALSDDANWQAMFDSIVALPQQAASNTPVKTTPVMVTVNGKQIAIPKVLARLVKPEQQWRSYGGKVFSLPLQSEDNVRMNLMYISQGVSIPQHTHKGFESTLVLHGGFSDENGHYDVGDFMQHDGQICHSPSTPQDQDCLCLTVLTEPMVFTQGVARIFNLFGKGLYP